MNILYLIGTYLINYFALNLRAKVVGSYLQFFETLLNYLEILDITGTLAI